MPGIFAAMSFTPSRACFFAAAGTPSFHWIRDTWMMVFGAAKRFCATSQVAVTPSASRVVTRRVRIAVVKMSSWMKVKGIIIPRVMDRWRQDDEDCAFRAARRRPGAVYQVLSTGLRLALREMGGADGLLDGQDRRRPRH